MTASKRWFGAAFALSALYALSPACGGATKSSRHDAINAGEGGDAAQGGSTGGREPTGGRPPTGGRAATGGDIGTGGEISTGGRPMPTGGSPATGGTGGEPDIDACESSSECILRESVCCACEPYRARDLFAINEAYIPIDSSDCAPCAECPALGERVPLMGNYFPACINRECEVIDVRETVATSCESDADCHLRNGAGCCPYCGDYPIALRDDAFLEQMLGCTSFEGCPECDSDLSGYAAVCEGNECRVVRAAQ
jgi:hypothetical protein